MNTLERFASLEIDGRETGALTMCAETKIAVEIFDVDIADNISCTCEIHFLGVLDARVRFLGDPWLGPISAHHAFSDSPYLTDRLDSSYFLDRLRRLEKDMANWSKYYHFSLTFEQSSIDVVAQDFAFLIVAKMPIETEFRAP